MTENSHSTPPPSRALEVLDAFYALYHELLPSLTQEQLEMLCRRLERYTREVQDDVSRAPSD